ncbi:MAG: thiamine phosphate synthase, partial [Nitrospinota bacterium]|nr:thiamine phosphate synthase [Nitrospinota bacterium]
MSVDHDPLYLITDRNAPPSGDITGALRGALEGGVRFLQFREKDLPRQERLDLGREVMSLAGEFGARVIVNGSPELAGELGAAGVHLGKAT